MRFVALMVVILFGVNITHAASLLTPSCAQCPAECPMHAKGISCHNMKSGSAAASTGDHCNRMGRKGAGLRVAGCQHHSTGIVAPDQPVVLAEPLLIHAQLEHPAWASLSSAPWVNLVLDPPFHPPQALPSA